jgi:hypothetical protein
MWWMDGEIMAAYASMQLTVFASVLDITHHISGAKDTGNPQNPHLRRLN